MNKFLISLIIFTTLSTQIFANPKFLARTGILVDYHSDEILFELDPDSQIYPASMTKIMTASVAFDLLKNNKLSLDDYLFLKCLEIIPSWIFFDVYNDQRPSIC